VRGQEQGPEQGPEPELALVQAWVLAPVPDSELATAKKWVTEPSVRVRRFHNLPPRGHPPPEIPLRAKRVECWTD